MIETAARAQVIYTYAETEAMQFGIMAEMGSKYGVKIMRWSDKDLAAYEKAWLEVIAEDSAKDPLFKKVADNFYAFRERYRVWGESQQLNATYLK
jgi:TRAP-type mannitol/chloroaromatic compound transport system substrate-binding protein